MLCVSNDSTVTFRDPFTANDNNSILHAMTDMFSAPTAVGALRSVSADFVAARILDEQLICVLRPVIDLCTKLWLSECKHSHTLPAPSRRVNE